MIHVPERYPSHAVPHSRGTCTDDLAAMNRASQARQTDSHLVTSEANVSQVLDSSSFRACGKAANRVLDGERERSLESHHAVTGIGRRLARTAIVPADDS